MLVPHPAALAKRARKKGQRKPPPRFPGFSAGLFRRFTRYGAGPAGPLLGRITFGRGSGVIVSAADRGRQHGDIERCGGFHWRGLARTTPTGPWRVGFRFDRRGIDDRRRRRLRHHGCLGGRTGRTFGAHFLSDEPIPPRTVPMTVSPPLAVIPAAIVSTFATRLALVAAFVGATVLIARRAVIRLRIGAKIVAAVIAAVEILDILVETVVARAEPLLLLFLAGAIVGKDAKIMVGELKIIFRIDPVARHLRVAGHILVFFKKLGRVAARAIVDAIAIVAATPIVAVGASIIVVPAAIAAAGLPVVDQDMILAFALPKFTENTFSRHPQAAQSRAS
jgi:hypothetical protein